MLQSKLDSVEGLEPPGGGWPLPQFFCSTQYWFGAHVFVPHSSGGVDEGASAVAGVVDNG